MRTPTGSSMVPGRLKPGYDRRRCRPKPGTTVSSNLGTSLADDASRRRDARGSDMLRMRATTGLPGRPARTARAIIASPARACSATPTSNGAGSALVSRSSGGASSNAAPQTGQSIRLVAWT